MVTLTLLVCLRRIQLVTAQLAYGLTLQESVLGLHTSHQQFTRGMEARREGLS